MKIETFIFLGLNYYFEDIQEVTALVFVRKFLVLFCLVRPKHSAVSAIGIIFAVLFRGSYPILKMLY
jgi:hypothetical protein